MVLLKRSFSVVVSTVIVLASPGKLARFPPFKILVRKGLSFWVYNFFQSPYVMSFLLYVGILSCNSKKMVLEHFTMSPSPCVRRPNSLEKYFTHLFLCLSCFIRCLYSSDSPVSSLMIYFDIILIYWWYIVSSGVLWKWDEIISGPTL